MQSSPVDIDECVTQSLCHGNASCTNTLGSFMCACDPGYTGDGLTCSGECFFRSSWNAPWVAIHHFRELHLTSSDVWWGEPVTLTHCHEDTSAIFHLQMLMNVWLSHLVMQVLPAPTHLGPSHVLATRGTLEMDWRAVVSAWMQATGRTLMQRMQHKLARASCNKC